MLSAQAPRGETVALLVKPADNDEGDGNVGKRRATLRTWGRIAAFGVGALTGVAAIAGVVSSGGGGGYHAAALGSTSKAAALLAETAGPYTSTISPYFQLFYSLCRCHLSLVPETA